jgi:hypothetical protein
MMGNEIGFSSPLEHIINELREVKHIQHRCNVLLNEHTAKLLSFDLQLNQHTGEEEGMFRKELESVNKMLQNNKDDIKQLHGRIWQLGIGIIASLLGGMLCFAEILVGHLG